MADYDVTVVDQIINVVPFGGDLLGGLVNLAQDAVNAAEAARDAAASSAASVQALAFTVAWSEQYADFLRWMQQGGVNGFLYDPSNLSTLWQDAAGTIPVTAVGQPVRRIDDLSGRGNHLTRSPGNCTLQRDAAGLLYVDVPSTGYFTSADTAQNKGTISFTSAFLAVAATRTVEETNIIMSISATKSDGLFVRDLQNGARFTATVNKTGYSATSLDNRSGSMPLGLPGVVDAMVDAGELSSWVNGGTTSLPLLGGGPRSAPTTFDGITEAYVSISANGRVSNNHACQFYGAAGAFTRVPDDLRYTVQRWLRSRTGQAYVDSDYYDVFATAGQSNDVGQDNDGSLAPAVPRGKGAHFIDTGFLRPMANPTQHLKASVSGTGSAWPAFALEWNSRTKRTAATIGVGANGCGLFTAGPDGDWSPTGPLMDMAVEKILAGMDHIKRASRGGVLRGVIWIGGEQDTPRLTSGSITLAAYKAALVGLRDRFRTKLGMPALPLYIVSADRRKDGDYDAGFALLRQAQAEAAAENAGIELVVPYQDFVGQGKISDTSGVHWSQPAQNEVGTIAADNIAALYGW